MEAGAEGEEISILCLGAAGGAEQCLAKCYLPSDAGRLIFLNDEQAAYPQCSPPQGEGGRVDSVQRLMHFPKGRESEATTHTERVGGLRQTLGWQWDDLALSSDAGWRASDCSGPAPESPWLLSCGMASSATLQCSRVSSLLHLGESHQGRQHHGSWTDLQHSDGYKLSRCSLSPTPPVKGLHTHTTGDYPAFS